MYLQGSTQEECHSNFLVTKELLNSLGIYFNEQKSVLTPARNLIHLGFHLNSSKMTVTLGDDKISKIKETCISVLTSRKLTIRCVAQLIGKFVSCFPGMEYGPLHFRHLEWNKSCSLKENKGNYEGNITLTTESICEINWWIKNVGKASRSITHGNAVRTLRTDASLQGWGANLLSGLSTGGRWSDTEKRDHINILELRAAFLGLQALCKSLSNVHIQLQMDNVTAVCYVNNMGGSHSVKCNELAFCIWEWCISKHIWLSATHIPGVSNVEADRESRLLDDKTEWRLNPDVFLHCVELWGKPDIDLFALRLNYQLKPYVSWRADPEALAIDAFKMNWSNLFLYIFPPFSLISRILQKLQDDQATAIMIVPKWPTQTWYPKLLSLMTSEPLNLPKTKDLLTLPGQQSKIHPLYPHLHMIACHLSAKASARRVLVKEHKTLS